MKLCHYVYREIFQKPPRNKLMLSKLDIQIDSEYDSHERVRQIEDNFVLLFLYTQRNSLIDLKLSNNRKSEISREICESICNGLTLLESLHFDVQTLPSYYTYFVILSPLINLKAIKCNQSNEATLGMIIRNGPNIESIILERACFRILNLIAENCLKVEHRDYKSVSFRHLKIKDWVSSTF